MGNPISPLLGKAVLVARLNSLMQAYSGIHPSLVELLKDLINKNIIPCIYEHGGVGASGDLVQLAHVGLNLIGEGKVWYEGHWQATASGLSENRAETPGDKDPRRTFRNQWHFGNDRIGLVNILY
jgi:histidine ammonia-lyase